MSRRAITEFSGTFNRAIQIHVRFAMSNPCFELVMTESKAVAVMSLQCKDPNGGMLAFEQYVQCRSQSVASLQF